MLGRERNGVRWGFPDSAVVYNHVLFPECHVLFKASYLTALEGNSNLCLCEWRFWGVGFYWFFYKEKLVVVFELVLDHCWCSRKFKDWGRFQCFCVNVKLVVFLDDVDILQMLIKNLFFLWIGNQVKQMVKIAILKDALCFDDREFW